MSSLLTGAATALGVLLAVDPAPEEGDVRPGTFYLFLVIGLVVVLVLLWLSLKKQLGRINVDRADDDPTRARDAQEE